MQTTSRSLLLIGIMACALAVQTVLDRHVAATEFLPPTPLLRPLPEFPLKLVAWQGRETDIRDPSWRYADSHLHRTYFNARRGQAVSLWMAYSRAGKDRDHNPEVCMPAHGKYEDTRQRQTLESPRVSGGSGAARSPDQRHAEPIQQFRFIKPRGGRGEWVFYWHYTLIPRIDPQQFSLLQLHYGLRRWNPASLTVEVFAPDIAPDDAAGAREFVLEVDRALQSHLPPGALRGSQRSAIKLIKDGGLR